MACTSESLPAHQTCSRLILMIILFCVAALSASPLCAQTYTILHTFTGGADGYYPQAGPILNGSSNLFGGAGNAVFRLKQTGPSWLLTPIFDFTQADGGPLEGRPTFGPGGALYGASAFGGSPYCADGAGCGFIFSMRPPSSICRTTSCLWTLTPLYQFDPSQRPDDGAGPQGGLIFDSAGNIYGTTNVGGLYNLGVVYELSPSQGSWTGTTLHVFDGSDGSYPNGNLVMDRAGNLIGTAQSGGPNCSGQFCGVVFELTHTSSGWVESTLHSFTSADGGYPWGGLVSDPAGNLYGTAMTGGANGGGIVYELMFSNGSYTFQTLYSFTASLGIFGPMGLLAIDGSGNLYGVTNQEGAFHAGNVFKLTHSGGQWIYSDLHDFTGGPGGSAPYDGPTLDPSGNLYGTTVFGGSGNNCPGGCGLLWEVAR